MKRAVRKRIVRTGHRRLRTIVKPTLKAVKIGDGKYKYGGYTIEKSWSKVFRNGYSNWDGKRWVCSWEVFKGGKVLTCENTKRECLLDIEYRIEKEAK